jgi:hypothetical protein
VAGRGSHRTRLRRPPRATCVRAVAAGAGEGPRPLQVSMRPKQSIAGDALLAQKSIFYFLPVDKGSQHLDGNVSGVRWWICRER